MDNKARAEELRAKVERLERLLDEKKVVDPVYMDPDERKQQEDFVKNFWCSPSTNEKPPKDEAKTPKPKKVKKKKDKGDSKEAASVKSEQKPSDVKPTEASPENTATTLKLSLWAIMAAACFTALH